MSEGPPRTEVARRRRPAVGATPDAPAPDVGGAEPRLPFGGRVGRFRLLEVLGEGGMGTVFLAEQSEPVSRHVAVKVMRSPLATAAEIARFEGEREALARLTHPAIAQLYEAGTVEESPWFAMELARGEPLASFCDTARLSIPERLSLFAEVCRAVHFAHQRGILHRDLKPSNVLVSSTTGHPVVKVIDFGIAKALDKPPSEATLLTPNLVIGTPGYMSPETLRGESDVDTRSDVYALGVILYELLCARRPFDDALGFAALALLVTTSDPPAPAVLFRALVAEARLEVSGRRDTAPEKLSRLLQGDLGLVASTAVALDRERRYDSALALALDVERAVSNEPISARAPTIPYRARKFVARHRLAVSLTALLVLAVVVASAGILAESARARRNDERAVAVASFLKGAFDSVDPWLSNPRDYTVREMLDQAVPRLRRELASRDDVRAELLETIGSVYFQLEEKEKAADLFGDVLAIQERRFGRDSVEAAAARHDYALAIAPRAPAEAAALLREVVVVRRRVRGPDHASVARAMHDLSGLVSAPVERESLLREALRIRLHVSSRETIGFSLRGLGFFLIERGRLSEARRYVARAYTITEPGTLQRERSAYYAGYLGLQEERWADAEAVLREALAISLRVRGDRNVKLAEIRRELGTALRGGGKLEEAGRELDAALALYRHLEKPAGEATAQTLAQIGLLSLARGEPQRAPPVLEEARTLFEAATPTAVECAWVYEGLAEVARAAGREGEAREYLEKAAAIRLTAFPPDHPLVLRSRALSKGGPFRPRAADKGTR